MINYKNNKGWIELICGPMFAGKTEELLRRINRASYADLKIMIFKPSIDIRNHNVVKSRSSQQKDAIEINDPFEIYKHINQQKNKPKIIAIDEVQFFDKSIVEIINTIANSGFIVIVSGLDLDFRGKPFHVTSKIASLSEYITKLSAICTICGEPGTITQRYIDGKPADTDAPTILIGNTESYTVRCREHHEIENKILNEESKKFIKINKTIIYN